MGLRAVTPREKAVRPPSASPEVGRDPGELERGLKEPGSWTPASSITGCRGKSGPFLPRLGSQDAGGPGQL